MIFLIITLAINALYVSLFNKTFGKMLPLTLMSLDILMYVSGFFNNFNIAIYMIIIASIYSICCIYKKIKNKDIEFRNNYLNISFIVTVIIFILIYILHYGRRFLFIDEFAHLGLMAKESYRLNAFHLIKESKMWYNKEYPPFYTLLEVLFCKLNGSFEERYCYMAMSFFNLSLLQGVFENIELKRKNILKIGLLFLMVLLIGTTINFTDSMAYNTLFYNSIYLDLPIGLLLGYIFVTIYNFDNSLSDYLTLVISLISLVLSKQISIAFYLLAIVTFIIINLLINKKKDYFNYLIVTSFPLIANFSWSFLVRKNGISSKFKIGDFDFFVIFKYFKNLTSDYETDIIKKFIDRVFYGSTIIKPFKMSYVFVTSIIVIIIVLLSYIKKNKKMLVIGLIYFLGTIGYAYAMMLSYVYSFGAYEGPFLTMFDRYMDTYIFFGYILLFIFGISITTKAKTYLIMLVVLLSFTSLNTLRTCKPVLKSEGMVNVYNKRYIEFISSLNDERVLVISQNDPLMRNVLRYYTIDYDKNTSYLDVEYAENANWDSGIVMWEDEFAEYLKDYDYIYLCDYDESFFHYKGYFVPEVMISHIYKIEWNNIYDVKCSDITALDE